MEVEFKVVEYSSPGEKIPEDYSLTTRAQAEAHLPNVMLACSSAGLQEGDEVRLKNGLLKHRGQDPWQIKDTYRPNLNHRLVSKLPNSGKELTKEDCQIALAYAAEHDDVDDELQELVECAGEEILSTRMPFAHLGTILHVCTEWASINTLEKVLKGYPKSVDVYILDRDDDTALHNLPNAIYARREISYNDCKRAACLLLGLHGVHANVLLSKQNKFRRSPVCKALKWGANAVCRALLDAGKEMEEKDSKAPVGHWLTLRAYQGSWSHTALHLAVLREYDDIVTKILSYPGAKGLDLTSLQDHKGNTPLHSVAKVGNTEICSMLLKYSMEINKDGGNIVISAQNKAGKTPLHIASSHGHTEMCEKLLEYGASLDLPDKRGKYALTNAFTKGHKQVVKILLDACLPGSAQDAKSELSVIHTKSEHSLINEKFEFGLTPLHVAVAISSEDHISKLLKAGAWVDSTSDDGRTPLHVATQQYDVDAFIKLLGETTDQLNVMDKKKQWKGWINMRDISGQTALHNLVQLSRHSAKDHSQSSDAMQISDEIISEDESSATEISDEGNEIEVDTDEVCSMVEVLLEKGAWVDVQDCDGVTALHVAAARSHDQVVSTLLSESQDHNYRSNRDKWIAMCDFSGETALHEAARTGRLKIVRQLLKQTKTERRADLLRVRDMKNMTALDWAAQKEKKNDTMIDEMMTVDLGAADQITRDFLMWNLKEHVNPCVHKDLCKKYKVEEKQTSLLQDAVHKRDVDIARELINRGADVPSLKDDDRRWLAQNLGKKASDQPTSEDTLGRKALVQGVANLLLNPYTDTPITIGIFGGWGSGKSSFMLQVEEAMLYMAVKETFSHDKESSLLKFSRTGAILRWMVVKALKQRMIKEDKYNLQPKQRMIKEVRYNQAKQSTDIENHKDPKQPKQSSDIENQKDADIENQKDEDDIINHFPMELQSKNRQLFKDLALTDRSKLERSHAGTWYKRKVGIRNQTLQDVHLTGYTPALLTLHYNAWQYDNKTEASAGLAVEISQQLESFMTPHQWLRMCWKYSWKSRPREICVHLLLPAFLALVSVCVVTILWKFVPIATKFKALSLPMGILGVMWVFFNTALKVIQPVTETMLNNPKSIDHRSMLGYQHQVIRDINFLKDQLCNDAHFGWKIVSFLCQLFISNSYFMEGTWIWKQHPRHNNFRIVLFIDDLDRCDEKTILEVLRATNLILGTCEISAVIGVDKSMVHRAITKEFLNDIGDKVLDIWVEDTDNKVAPEEKVPKVVDKKSIQDEKDSQKVESNKKMGKDDKHAFSHELAEKYLQKIIHLPIEIPDPSRKHIECFLEGQVGKLQKDKMEDPKNKVHKDKQKKNKRKLTKEYVEGKQVKDEEDPQSQDKTENDASNPIGFRLLLANYTPVEKDMLIRLCQLTTKEGGFPREWKQFLNYHQLAWTILSQDPNMKSKEFKGWQRKLILWIFICWNWRDQMDVIFENWLDIISKWQAQMHLQEKDKNDGISLELCDIIDTYMKSKEWSAKENNQIREKQGGEIAPKAWIDLYETLIDEYDIPMHFIEKFQQFRFYCKLNHLEIDEQYQSKKMAHWKSLRSRKSTFRLGHQIYK